MFKHLAGYSRPPRFSPRSTFQHSASIWGYLLYIPNLMGLIYIPWKEIIGTKQIYTQLVFIAFSVVEEISRIIWVRVIEETIPHEVGFLRFCLSSFRERGRDRERGEETSMWEKHQSVASCTWPDHDQTCNPGMCPDRELNRRPCALWDDIQPTELH